ncbi:sugar ABC transporter permease [Frigidibacter sp. SD6-1]|uniref:sugar ABC transporter permease n=1 Tax=Frigidibacter sp. SD6-1 TaxID=3032581 RepID=UPI0024DF7F6B|nr:sugar ABC transporter permease [Frigidibacter sp. SD6-1]
MTQTTSPHTPTNPNAGIVERFLRATEIDTRLLGMVGALFLIWVGFELYVAFWLGRASIFSGFAAIESTGFLTPRNLWNLSVQVTSIAIMATGMVLVIVTRHIDLSVGSVLCVVAVIMAMLQSWVLPGWLGLGHPAIWIITVFAGLLCGTLIGAFHGTLIAYLGIPSFIVTLGGLMVWRGVAFLLSRGETITPLDSTFLLLGGGPLGAIGSVGSWIVCLLACAGILWMLVSGRRSRVKHGFPLRPMWAEYTLGAIGFALVVGATLVVNAYPWPKGIVEKYASENGIAVPEEGLFISHGWAIPVMMLIVVALVMTILMTRTRFGRYVYAIGGNPDAAELSGINTRWMTVKIFALMGFLAGLSAIVSSARLTSASAQLGELDELFVIASAVIGGTSLAGGVGTIHGAILGALIMWSLQQGMVLIGFGDGSYQKIVVGAVLVLAVYLDILYRKRVK